MPAGVIQVYQTALAANGDGTINVQFSCLPSRSYEIERSTDLKIWTLQQTATAPANGTLLFHDATPPAGGAYYRIRETP